MSFSVIKSSVSIHTELLIHYKLGLQEKYSLASTYAIVDSFGYIIWWKHCLLEPLKAVAGNIAEYSTNKIQLKLQYLIFDKGQRRLLNFKAFRDKQNNLNKFVQS